MSRRSRPSSTTFYLYAMLRFIALTWVRSLAITVLFFIASYAFAGAIPSGHPERIARLSAGVDRPRRVSVTATISRGAAVACGRRALSRLARVPVHRPYGVQLHPDRDTFHLARAQRGRTLPGAPVSDAVRHTGAAVRARLTLGYLEKISQRAPPSPHPRGTARLHRHAQ